MADAAPAFALPGPAAHIEPSADPRDVVLRFAGPVDTAAMERIQALWPELVEYVNAGYDQVLVRGKRPLHAELRPIAGGIQLALQPAGETTSDAESANAAERDAAIRRELLRAKLDAYRGDDAAARERLKALAAKYGEKPEILAALGDAEEARGNWRPARDMYRRASSLDRDNEYYAEAERRSATQAAPFIHGETEIAAVKHGDRQVISLLQGRASLTDRNDAEMNVERRGVRADATDLRGAPVRLDTSLERYELALSHRFDDAGAIRAALLQSSEGTSGGALSHTLRDANTTTTFGATYHRAYWELVSGLANKGVQDFVEARQERQFGNGWSALYGLRYNRYGVDGDDDVTKSLGMVGGLRKALPLELEGLQVSAGYNLDAEYIHTQQLYAAPGGQTFRPLAISTREIHSTDLGVNQKIGDGARIDLYGGYAYDRYNTGGLFAGLALVLTDDAAYEFGLRASHAKALSRGEQSDVNRAGIYGTLRF